jgi:serine/threonine-protein kinase
MHTMFMHVDAPRPELSRWLPDAPEELSALLRRLLAKDPADRPQSARAASRELSRVRALFGGVAQRLPGRSATPVPPPRRPRTPAPVRGSRGKLPPVETTDLVPALEVTVPGRAVPEGLHLEATVKAVPAYVPTLESPRSVVLPATRPVRGVTVDEPRRAPVLVPLPPNAQDPWADEESAAAQLERAAVRKSPLPMVVVVLLALSLLALGAAAWRDLASPPGGPPSQAPDAAMGALPAPLSTPEGAAEEEARALELSEPARSPAAPAVEGPGAQSALAPAQPQDTRERLDASAGPPAASGT